MPTTTTTTDTDTLAAPAMQEDVTTTLYRAAIGPVSTDYYLPLFVRFEAANRAGITWNTAAGLLTLNWLIFRQLWSAALAYVGIVLSVVVLVFGIGALVFHFSSQLQMTLLLGFGVLAFVVPGLFGNVLLHTQCRQRMTEAVAANAKIADACTQLARQASTRRRVLVQAVINFLLLLLGLLLYVQFSSFGSNVPIAPTGAVVDGGGHVTQGTVTQEPASDPAGAGKKTFAPPTTAPLPSAPVSTLASAPAVKPSMPASTPAAKPSVPASVPAVAVSAPASAPSTKASAPTVTPPRTVAASAPASVPASAPTPTPTPKPVPVVRVSKPYFINVGLFAVADNAKNVEARLQAVNVPVQLKEIPSSDQGVLTRVRAGPFTSRSQAQAAAQTIQELKLDAVIVQ